MTSQRSEQTQERDQPRMLAVADLAMGNFAWGLTGLLSSTSTVPVYSKAADAAGGSLHVYWIAFMVLAVVILQGPRSPHVARVTSLIAVGVWLVWAWLIYRAVALPDVSAAAAVVPAWIASWHLALFPYWRRQERRAAYIFLVPYWPRRDG